MGGQRKLYIFKSLVKGTWRGERRHWFRLNGLMSLDSLFQKTPIINPQKRTIQPRDADEDTAFKLGFEIVKSKPCYRVSVLTFFVNLIPPMAEIEVIPISAFLTLYIT
jgi:hypothetical protein